MSVPGRRHPFQVLIALFATLTGISYLVLGPRPGSSVAVLSEPLLYLWAASLLYSGGLLLWAAFAPEGKPRLRESAFWAEYIAHPVLAFSCFTYAFPLLSVWPRGAFSGAILLATTLASGTRWYFVNQTRRKTLHELEDENAHDPHSG